MEMQRRKWAEQDARYQAQAKDQEADHQEAARLIRRLGAAYTEYTGFLEARPHLSQPLAGTQAWHAPLHPASASQATGQGEATAKDEADAEAKAKDRLFYEQLRRNLGHADDAPRCTHIKPDGIRCGSPRMKTGKLCYAHQRMLECRAQRLRLPPMEDPNSIQLGLMEVSRALLDGQISEKTAGLLFYGLQTAAGNVERLTFHQAPGEIALEEIVEPSPAPGAATRAEVPAFDAAFIYGAMDDDLKARLQEISDEFDCRRAEQSRAEPSLPEHSSA
jgi:hypothetical protein